MGTEGEGFEAPPEAEAEPRVAGQGQCEHHQGGERGTQLLLSQRSGSSSVCCFTLNVSVVQVFSDQLLLKDALSRSDRALAVVKDLFGDGPRRKTGECTGLLCFSFAV